MRSNGDAVPTKFLYLTKREWADTWINGGEIPIALASQYLSSTREGVLTPDENKIYDLPVDEKTLLDHGVEIGEARNISLKLTSGGRLITQFRNRNTYSEDGRILCFCNEKSPSLMKRFGKEVCVEIPHVLQLKTILDAQLGVRSRAGNCLYTGDHRRDHFLKSSADSWQQEYRLFWSGPGPQKAVLPPGIAKLVQF